jgi:hypothetical protein
MFSKRGVAIIVSMSIFRFKRQWADEVCGKTGRIAPWEDCLGDGGVLMDGLDWILRVLS